MERPRAARRKRKNAQGTGGVYTGENFLRLRMWPDIRALFII
jgi:hypothetical protein